MQFTVDTIFILASVFGFKTGFNCPVLDDGKSWSKKLRGALGFIHWFLLNISMEENLTIVHKKEYFHVDLVPNLTELQ